MNRSMGMALRFLLAVILIRIVSGLKYGYPGGNGRMIQAVFFHQLIHIIGYNYQILTYGSSRSLTSCER